MTRAHGHPLIDPCGRLRTTRDAHFRIALRLLTGTKSHDWCCIWIPNMNPIARGGVRQPFIARQMNDGACLQAPTTWWRVGLMRAVAE